MFNDEMLENSIDKWSEVILNSCLDIRVKTDRAIALAIDILTLFSAETAIWSRIFSVGEDVTDEAIRAAIAETPGDWDDWNLRVWA